MSFCSSKRFCFIRHLSNAALANALIAKFVLVIDCIFPLFSASAGMMTDLFSGAGLTEQAL